LDILKVGLMGDARRRLGRIVIGAAVLTATASCNAILGNQDETLVSSDATVDSGVAGEAGHRGADAGHDASTHDAGTSDAGMDAGTDTPSGPGPDAPPPVDTGVDHLVPPPPDARTGVNCFAGIGGPSQCKASEVCCYTPMIMGSYKAECIDNKYDCPSGDIRLDCVSSGDCGLLGLTGVCCAYGVGMTGGMLTSASCSSGMSCAPNPILCNGGGKCPVGRHCVSGPPAPPGLSFCM
jgi:hypothetical protein